MKPYYDHGGITIYHGDCREVLPTLEAADLTLSDPPFNFEPGGGGIIGRRTYTQKLDEVNCCDFDPSWFLPLVRSAADVFFCNKVLIPAYIERARQQKRSWDLHVMQKTAPIPAFNSVLRQTSRRAVSLWVGRSIG